MVFKEWKWPLQPTMILHVCNVTKTKLFHSMFDIVNQLTITKKDLILTMTKGEG